MSQQHYQHGFSFNQIPAGSASNINYFNFNLNPEQEGVDVVKVNKHFEENFLISSV